MNNNKLEMMGGDAETDEMTHLNLSRPINFILNNNQISQPLIPASLLIIRGPNI